MSDLTVACVLKSGGIYNEDWVRRLANGVARHLDRPYRFVCLTDMKLSRSVPCERIQLEEGWQGWWSKIELFRPGLLTGRTLYFDLDTVIVGDLGEIADYPHVFTMAHEYYRPKYLCSTAMAWSGEWSSIWHEFKRNPRAVERRYAPGRPDKRIGDQAFIEDVLEGYKPAPDTFRDLFGETSIASYKVHGCQKRPPKGAAAVAFHGTPKPHQIAGGWVKEMWQ